MSLLSRLLGREPEIEDPNAVADGEGDVYTLGMAELLRRLDAYEGLDTADGEDDTANFYIEEDLLDE
jgi:hypothetical protein